MSFRGSLRCYPLGWHAPDDVIASDEVNSKSTCVRCKVPVMLDSQGNWFEVSYRTFPPEAGGGAGQ